MYPVLIPLIFYLLFSIRTEITFFDPQGGWVGKKILLQPTIFCLSLWLSRYATFLPRSFSAGIYFADFSVVILFQKKVFSRANKLTSFAKINSAQANKHTCTLLAMPVLRMHFYLASHSLQFCNSSQYFNILRLEHDIYSKNKLFPVSVFLL